MKLIIYVNCNNSKNLLELEQWLSNEHASADNVPDIDFKLEGSPEEVREGFPAVIVKRKIYAAAIIESVWQFEALMASKIKNNG